MYVKHVIAWRKSIRGDRRCVRLSPSRGQFPGELHSTRHGLEVQSRQVWPRARLDLFKRLRLTRLSR